MELKFWEGPDWLKKPTTDFLVFNFICDGEEINQEKLKGVSSLLVKNENTDVDWYYKYFSKFHKICIMDKEVYF